MLRPSCQKLTSASRIGSVVDVHLPEFENLQVLVEDAPSSGAHEDPSWIEICHHKVHMRKL